MPIAAFIFLRKQYDVLEKDEFRERFGAFYED